MTFSRTLLMLNSLLINKMDKMIKKLVFCIYTPMKDRDYVRYGIKDLIQRGVNVKVIDLSILQYPEIESSAFNDNCYYSDLVYKVQTMDRFVHEIELISSLDVIISVGLPKVSLYRAMKKSSAKVGFQLWGTIPFKKGGVKNKLNRMIKTLSLTRIYNIVDDVKRYYYYNIKEVDFLLAAGSKCKDLYFKRNNIKKVINCHSYDYSYFQKNIKNITKSKFDERYIVFIDQMLPLHPDNKRFTQDLTPYTFDYFNRLRRTFAIVENEMNCKVVIACHPRANYSEDDKEAYFGNRKVFYGETLNLINECCLCLTHYSTSISFAAICNKRVLFLDDPIMELNGGKNIALNMAAMFGSNLLSTRLLQFDVGGNNSNVKMLKYISDYITIADSDKTNCEIIMREFKL